MPINDVISIRLRQDFQLQPTYAEPQPNGKGNSRNKSLLLENNDCLQVF